MSAPNEAQDVLVRTFVPAELVILLDRQAQAHNTTRDMHLRHILMDCITGREAERARNHHRWETRMDPDIPADDFVIEAYGTVTNPPTEDTGDDD